ncbi:MAG TPA: hypothetical protein P5147_08865 [Myxococcota bacterium]|nr:hypothetical protein [Myxococcota bacterium]HRY93561.1 hypothetical protein [Myxococcota bacterium]
MAREQVEGEFGNSSAVRATIILQIEAADFDGAWAQVLKYMQRFHGVKDEEIKCLKKTRDSRGSWWIEVEHPAWSGDLIDF